MLVSWEWLSQYVRLDIAPDELAHRFAMTGLNLESISTVDGDTVIDLEVTSNRGDCLGHIGIAREASVLLNQSLKIPSPVLNAGNLDAGLMKDGFRIVNEAPEGCLRYRGRLVRGVRVGPSPAWLVKRLKAVGVNSVNNVVDITNYVMLESGHPLHAFDLARIRGEEIRVRRAHPKESFTAIDHRLYQLDPSMVVIADAERAVALAGVMGGLDSEVSESTRDLLIEAASFTPLWIRRTARKLRLHSPSSFRFERRVDPAGIPWAADRCCQLIVELAGGKCSPDALDSWDAEPNRLASSPSPILLRASRVTRVLGIEVPWEKCVDILRTLGCVAQPPAERQSERSVLIVPPSFRHDLTREIDLIEEIARIHGYELIPEDAAVPTMASARRPKDALLDRVRSVAMASGLDEALTPSVVNQTAATLLSPWTDQPPLQTQVPLLEGATFLRRSLVPSLLQAYQLNQSQQERDAALFEIAMVYLPSAEPGKLPREQWTMGWVTPADPRTMTGMIEEIITRVVGQQRAATLRWELEDIDWPSLQPQTGLWRKKEGRPMAWEGRLSRSCRDSWKLDRELSVGEIDLSYLLEHLQLVPTLEPLAAFPAIQRDLNFIVDEATRWDRLAATITRAAGPLLRDCCYRETYRDPKRDGTGFKRILLTLVLQSRERTLTSEEADQSVQAVIRATADELGARLLA